MIILISGATHSGKTKLAQQLLEKYHYPYLSIDHLKMGLIRSKNTCLTPTSDSTSLTNYLWPIAREIIKTNIENNQNLIVEGCYIPFDYKNDFNDEELKQIKYLSIILSKDYIINNFQSIKEYENVIEKRLYDEINIYDLIKDNQYYLENVKKYNLNYILITDKYDINIDNI